MSSLEKRKEGMGPGEYEQKAVEAGFVRVCGCDEAGPDLWPDRCTPRR